MKYLVNRETKEHVKCGELTPYFGDYKRTDLWHIVEADSEGWIPWSGGECPLSEGAAVAARYRCGEEFEGHALKDSNFATVNAGARFWRNDCAHPYDIIAYRPILTEQAEPVKDSVVFRSSNYTTQTFPSVFDRLKAASQVAASIPSIIAEIDELLGPDYQVVRVEKIEATAPQEDMSDWRNWRAGDWVKRISPSSPSVYTVGNLYAVHSVTDGAIRIHDDCGANSFCYFQEDAAEKFTFHSRPSGVTK